MEAWIIAIIVILCILLPLLIIKLFAVLTIGWNNSQTCLVGKTVLVTGSNIGIGYYTALDFAKRGARVILACRNPARAETARAQMVEATGNQNIVVKILDLSSLTSVRGFAKEINETEERLDILVNNAGIGCIDHSITSDGLSLTMQSNHFGPFLLTILLLNLLKKSAPSRIINVASDLAKIGKININDLNAFPRGIFTKARDYSNTKLCNLLFTTELARKLEGTGVTTNAVHPGAVQSDFLKDSPTLALKISKVIMLLFYKKTEAGAQTSIYAAVSKDIEGVNGGYFVECKKASMPSQGLDVGLSKMLWEKSEEFVKLTAEEKSCFSFKT